jgi:hypothetical protein
MAVTSLLTVAVCETPTESGVKFYNTLKMWDANKNIDFGFVNSHDKTCIAFLVATDNTKNSSDILDCEIVSSKTLRQN